MTTIIPEEVRMLFAFVDIGESPAQCDVLVCGFSEDGTCYVLGHRTIAGSIRDNATQEELAELLDRRFEHPWGGTLRIGAAAIDEGSGLHSEAARQFRKRMINRPPFINRETRWRFMYTSKGVSPSDFIVKKSDNPKLKHLLLIGCDQLKALIYSLLKAGTGIEFSESLSDPWYKELTSEHRVQYDGRLGQTRVGYEKIVKSARNEALDCLVGCFALYHFFKRKLSPMVFAAIEADLRKQPQAAPALVPENIASAADIEEAPSVPKPYIPRNPYLPQGYGEPRPERSPQDDPSQPIPQSENRPAAIGSWFNKR